VAEIPPLLTSQIPAHDQILGHDGPESAWMVGVPTKENKSLAEMSGERRTRRPKRTGIVKDDLGSNHRYISKL
jgi:hypothetical protein